MEQNFGEANFWWIKLKMHLDGNILAVEYKAGCHLT